MKCYVVVNVIFASCNNRNASQKFSALTNSLIMRLSSLYEGLRVVNLPRSCVPLKLLKSIYFKIIWKLTCPTPGKPPAPKRRILSIFNYKSLKFLQNRRLSFVSNFTLYIASPPIRNIAFAIRPQNISGDFFLVKWLRILTHKIVAGKYYKSERPTSNVDVLYFKNDFTFLYYSSATTSQGKFDKKSIKSLGLWGGGGEVLTPAETSLMRQCNGLDSNLLRRQRTYSTAKALRLMYRRTAHCSEKRWIVLNDALIIKKTRKSS